MVRLSPTDLVDAAYTKNQAWKSEADTLGEEPGEFGRHRVIPKTISAQNLCVP